MKFYLHYKNNEIVGCSNCLNIGEEFECREVSEEEFKNYISICEKKQKDEINNYENLVVSKVRERYTIDQELAILRQRDTKPEEFAEYNAYVEQCKVEAKEEVNGN